MGQWVAGPERATERVRLAPAPAPEDERQADIKPDIEVCPVEEINEIYARLDAGNSGHVRYVLDIAGSLKEDEFDDAIRRCQGKAAPKLSPFSRSCLK